MGLEFFYTQPVRIWFGAGQFDRLGEILNELGLKHCVAVCDPFLKIKLEALSTQNKAICAVFSGVEENPQLSGVEAVIRLIRETGADGVIGVGGGSTMDTAKFSAAAASAEGEAIDCFRGVCPFPAEHIPVLTVPTTAGTGSEVTQVSVISHGKEKKTINNPAFMPSC